METLIERSVCTNSRCYSCGALVYAVEKKKTANHVYHNGCFRCRICKRNLTGLTLNEEGDDIYCGNCYRKKQRGDCNSVEFQRAAVERAEYVHTNHHPDQSPPIANPRPPVKHDLSRHPSWTLRQLERKFLSYDETKISKKSNDSYPKLVLLPYPTTIKTSFSTPTNPTKFRNYSLSTKDEPSPPLHFSPVFSSVGSTPRTPQPINKQQVKFFTKSTDNIHSRLHQSNIDLTNIKSPFIERKHRSVIELKPKNENIDKKKEAKFYFPDLNTTPTRRRSASANYNINRRK